MKKMDTSIVWQIGVVVEDVEAVTRKLQEIFGFEEAAEVTMNGTAAYEGADVYYDGKQVRGDFKGAFYDFGSVQIEFMSPADDGPSVWRDFLEQHGQGIHHVAWKVADAKETERFIVSKGLKMMQKGKWPTGRYAYFDGLESIGMIIETLEFDGERKAGKPLEEKWYERTED